MFCARSFLDLIFSLTYVSISSLMSSVSMILSSISCNLLVKLASVVPVEFLFFFLLLSLDFLYSIFIFMFSVALFLSSVFVFVDSFKGCIHFLFKDLYHTHKACFVVFFLCFSYFGIFRACSGRVAGLSRRHVVLTVVDFSLHWCLGIWDWEDSDSR